MDGRRDGNERSPERSRALSRTFEPDVAAITLDRRGAPGVPRLARRRRRGQGEILEGLKPGGIFVVNEDDARIAAIAARHSRPDAALRPRARGETCARATSGRAGRQPLRADDARGRGRGRASAAGPSSGRELSRGRRRWRSRAAPAVGGLRRGLGADLQPAPHRGELHRHASGALLYDDAYNANPSSMRAALDDPGGAPRRAPDRRARRHARARRRGERWHREAGALRPAAAPTRSSASGLARARSERARSPTASPRARS